MNQNPILLELTRGLMTEAWHRGAYVVVRDGEVVDAAGIASDLICLRSAAKPIQALAHVMSGAATRFSLDDRALALLCASHGGEPHHVEVACAMLEAGSLGPSALRCGAHFPLHAKTAEAMRSGGQTPTALHNNCSGKHAGMLLSALVMGEPLETYLDLDHPHQQRIVNLLLELAEVEAASLATAIDGCSAPTFFLTLEATARAMSNYASLARSGAGVSGLGTRRILAALAAAPEMIGGTARFDTEILAASKGRIITKIGAQGFYGAMVPALGLGVALHVDDGDWNGSERVMAGLLARHSVLDDHAMARLHPYLDPVRRNHRGLVVGEVRLTLPAR